MVLHAEVEHTWVRFHAAPDPKRRPVDVSGSALKVGQRYWFDTWSEQLLALGLKPARRKPAKLSLSVPVERAIRRSVRKAVVGVPPPAPPRRYLDACPDCDDPIPDEDQHPGRKRCRTCATLANRRPVEGADPEWRAYHHTVWKLTEAQDLTSLEHNELRGFHGHHLDHIVSVWHGYTHGLPAPLIASLDNLRFVPRAENVAKGRWLSDEATAILASWSSKVSCWGLAA